MCIRDRHCVKTKMLKEFEKIHNCSLFPMFGTGDLSLSIPMCNRSNTQKMMNTLSRMENISCLPACIEESIDISISFTLVSDQMFANACSEWKVCDGITKEDAVWMDLYFTNLETQV